MSSEFDKNIPKWVDPTIDPGNRFEKQRMLLLSYFEYFRDNDAITKVRFADVSEWSNKAIKKMTFYKRLTEFNKTGTLTPKKYGKQCISEIKTLSERQLRRRKVQYRDFILRHDKEEFFCSLQEPTVISHLGRDVIADANAGKLLIESARNLLGSLPKNGSVKQKNSYDAIIQLFTLTGWQNNHIHKILGISKNFGTPSRQQKRDRKPPSPQISDQECIIALEDSCRVSPIEENVRLCKRFRGDTEKIEKPMHLVDVSHHELYSLAQKKLGEREKLQCMFDNNHMERKIPSSSKLRKITLECCPHFSDSIPVDYHQCPYCLVVKENLF